MNRIYSIFLILLGVCAGIGVSYFRLTQTKQVTVLHPQDLPSLEHFISDSSFSESENAIDVVRALSARRAMELRNKRQEQGLTIIDHNATPARAAWSEAEQDLQEAIHEFRNTRYAMTFILDLLLVLKAQKDYDRWVQTYLAALYANPTDELIGRLTKEAVEMGKNAGQEAAVLDALNHLEAIPMEFETKQHVKTALSKLNPDYKLAGQSDFSAALVQ